MTTNLAEELLLLALHDPKGTVVWSTSESLPYGLAGAVLLELTFRGRLRSEQQNLVVTDATSTEDEILDEALAEIQESKRAKRPYHWVSKLNRATLKSRLLDRLIHKGILRREEHRVLWVVPSQRYPTEDSRVEQELRNRLRAVILNRATPNPQTAALISLVNACNLVDEIFSGEERKMARMQAKEIAEGELVGKAISDTVAGIQASITTLSEEPTMDYQRSVPTQSLFKWKPQSPACTPWLRSCSAFDPLWNNVQICLQRGF